MKNKKICRIFPTIQYARRFAEKKNGEIMSTLGGRYIVLYVEKEGKVKRNICRKKYKFDIMQYVRY